MPRNGFTAASTLETQIDVLHTVIDETFALGRRTTIGR